VGLRYNDEDFAIVFGHREAMRSATGLAEHREGGSRTHAQGIPFGVTVEARFYKLEDTGSVLPICIEDTDREGRRIAWGWFTAVVPIANRLRHLARRRLGDVWRVSELAESTVHAAWYKYGDDLGLWPTSRLWHHGTGKTSVWGDGARGRAWMSACR
jgi:hypothetical protein